jgi:hypothetical protein
MRNHLFFRSFIFNVLCVKSRRPFPDFREVAGLAVMLYVANGGIGLVFMKVVLPWRIWAWYSRTGT